jgi:hypothetical protein
MEFMERGVMGPLVGRVAVPAAVLYLASPVRR